MRPFVQKRMGCPALFVTSRAHSQRASPYTPIRRRRLSARSPSERLRRCRRASRSGASRSSAPTPCPHRRHPLHHASVYGWVPSNQTRAYASVTTWSLWRRRQRRALGSETSQTSPQLKRITRTREPPFTAIFIGYSSIGPWQEPLPGHSLHWACVTWTFPCTVS